VRGSDMPFANNQGVRIHYETRLVVAAMPSSFTTRHLEAERISLISVMWIL
jgi:hypothetical protein